MRERTKPGFLTSLLRRTRRQDVFPADLLQSELALDPPSLSQNQEKRTLIISLHTEQIEEYNELVRGKSRYFSLLLYVCAMRLCWLFLSPILHSTLNLIKCRSR